ncbi:MAG: peptidylprolyl isomerase [Oscillospiraceae bacterium]|nr:peptidylprolyl isomerase [Oscillospiraceae bacterium]
MKKTLKTLLLTVICTVFMTACSGGVSLGSEKLNVKTSEIQLQQPQSGDTVVTITTSEGEIKVVLFPEYAPKAVQNFVSLAENGYYDNTVFHRVIADFIIQGGSPDGTPGGGTSCWGLEFEDEFSDFLHHYNGALAMANHGADTNGSQFYFVTAPLGKMDDATVARMEAAGWDAEVVSAYKEAGGMPRLDYRYTVFGQIYDGLNVAYKISRAETNESDRPVKDITVQSVVVSVIE